MSVMMKFRHASFLSAFLKSPRGGVEEEQWESLSALMSTVLLLPTLDRWLWIPTTTQVNLNSIGLDISSISCPIYEDGAESVSHLFSPVLWL
ncbi:hypothetical protein L2E82_50762 [Cichorium intybus]|nr:hypothetical protein L2E82_50762 [Cichorium intybus]